MALKKCYCEGCLANDDENPVLLAAKCKVRSCVIKKGLENCAYCEEYPCEKLMDTAGLCSREKFIARHGEIPEEDYNICYRMFENAPRLEGIRQKLGYAEDR